MKKPKNILPLSPINSLNEEFERLKNKKIKDDIIIKISKYFISVSMLK